MNCSNNISMIDLISNSTQTTQSQSPGTHHHELLSENQMQTIAVLSLLTSGLSFIGSGSVFLCAVYLKRVCYPEVFPTFHLALADMLSSLFLIISSSIFLTSPVKSTMNYPGTPGPCAYLMAIVTSAYTLAFFLTITYALEAYFRFRKRLVDTMNMDLMTVQVVSNRWMYLVYIVAWLLPVIFGGILMYVTHSLRDCDDDVPPNSKLYYHYNRTNLSAQCSSCFPVFWFNEDHCWKQVDEGHLMHVVIRLIFLIPLLMVMVLNMILYVLVAKVFKQVAMRRGLLSYHQRKEEQLLKKKAFLYQGVFYLCWLPSVILGIVSLFTSYSMAKFFWLLVIQAIFGPLQGILNSIVYGWKRDSFRRALNERTSLLSTNRTTAISAQNERHDLLNHRSSVIKEVQKRS
ncbi:transmembrane protein 116-like isoform X2 [Biomphalaria glabrata]|uniref:Transmembrane protein 116-like isoform X2 n=1 Tax=Biomphalaria glabrata TaxID=6526 RepID=A0A9W3A5Z2_BIOGL|nr:transmembrane protein 116-like isoform X2 [Biomphalaria glabrata]